MSETSLQGARVLIAEDEALVALYAETVLEEAGAQIVGTTATIVATLQAIENEPVVLCCWTSSCKTVRAIPSPICSRSGRFRSSFTQVTATARI